MIPTTSTGLGLFTVSPSPSWPLKLYPKHWIEPPLISAQVCDKPLETAMALVMPETVTGVRLQAEPPQIEGPVVVPSPS